MRRETWFWLALLAVLIVLAQTFDHDEAVVSAAMRVELFGR